MESVSATLTKIVISQVFSLLKDELSCGNNEQMFDKLISNINVHQTMIEDGYLSPLRTYLDYISLERYVDAANSLMELSNRRGTPFVNYLLAATLLKIGNEQLAYKKLEKAINGNPYLFKLIKDDLNFDYKNAPTIPSWNICPCNVEDDFRYKFFRFIGTPVNEGITRVLVNSLGGDICYMLFFDDIEKCVIGMVSLSSGNRMWSHEIEYKKDNELSLCSEDYVIAEVDGIYHIFDPQSGIEIIRYSSNLYHTVFFPKQIAGNSNFFEEFACNIEGASMVRIKTHSDKKLKVSLYRLKERSYTITHTEGRYRSTSFRVHKEKYYYDVCNMKLCLE